MNKMRTFFKGFARLTIIVAVARWVDLHCWKRYMLLWSYESKPYNLVSGKGE